MFTFLIQNFTAKQLKTRAACCTISITSLQSSAVTNEIFLPQRQDRICVLRSERMQLEAGF